MPPSFALTGADIFDGETRHSGSALLVENGRVASIVPASGIPAGAERIALSGGLIAPGFIDLQVNGGGGALLNADRSVEGVRTLCHAHARFGTTALLPTVITDVPEVTADAVRAVREAIAANVAGCLGIHIEGPFLARARKGTHREDLIRPMGPGDFDLVGKTGIGIVLLTVAAETVPPEAIRRLTADGVIVSIGHTDADCATVLEAQKAGARSVTHLFNAMSQLGHRAPGVVGAALNSGELWGGIIADGFHVDPVALEVAIRAKKGPGKLFLVTDAMSTVGSEAQTFELNGRTVYRKDGRLTLDNGTLAGSDLDMMSAVRFTADRLGQSFEEAIRMASLYPAEFLGIDGDHGCLRPGSRADIVHITDARDVGKVWIGGEEQRF
ncbi:N-acetylglucosamine-6-phosphate deacetylase [Faunimonas pinastri]|uniref:N-acetylglucosamine-6-phosphate deacetylase n=1 Tax=Faunimonas pinastri TaxID=1855383 RepID=UPI003D178D76